ncbi:uncharacterized protein ACO6RY_17619 [Pungitius sinensis]
MVLLLHGAGLPGWQFQRPGGRSPWKLLICGSVARRLQTDPSHSSNRINSFSSTRWWCLALKKKKKKKNHRLHHVNVDSFGEELTVLLALGGFSVQYYSCFQAVVPQNTSINV